MVTRRFTQSLADLGGHLTQRAEDILLARHLHLLVGEDVTVEQLVARRPRTY